MKNQIWLGAMLVAALVAACAGEAPRTESTAAQESSIQEEALAPAAETTYASFDCGGVQLLASFEGETVTLDFEGEKVQLSRVESASGARYSDGETTFWTQAEEAILERPAGATDCTVQPIRSQAGESGAGQ